MELDLDIASMEVFNELVREHCEHLLHEFFGNRVEPATTDDERRRAVLCLMAASTVQIAIAEVLTEHVGMPPETVADIYEKTTMFARSYARDLEDLFDTEPATVSEPEPEPAPEPASSRGVDLDAAANLDAFLQICLVPGGDA